MLRKGDLVKLSSLCDSPYLKVGDEGVVMQDMDGEGFVPVEFEVPFEDATDCDGSVPNGNGWWVHVHELEKI